MTIKAAPLRMTNKSRSAQKDRINADGMTNKSRSAQNDKNVVPRRMKNNVLPLRMTEQTRSE